MVDQRNRKFESDIGKTVGHLVRNSRCNLTYVNLKWRNRILVTVKERKPITSGIVLIL